VSHLIFDAILFSFCLVYFFIHLFRQNIFYGFVIHNFYGINDENYLVLLLFLSEMFCDLFSFFYLILSIIF